MVAIADYLAQTWRPDREYVDGVLVDRNVGALDHSLAQSAVAGHLSGIKAETGMRALISVRVRIKPTRFRIPDVCLAKIDVRDADCLEHPPFLCVEILSKDDTMSSMQERIADFLDFGVPYLSVIDPRLKRCYAYSRDGMRTIVEGDLVTENPEIKLPLSFLFS